MPFPNSLRIAIGFLVGIWTVGIVALMVGAPGELVLAAAAIGTVAAIIECTARRPGDAPRQAADDPVASAETTPDLRPEAPIPRQIRQKH